MRWSKFILTAIFITAISSYLYFYLLLPQVVGWDEANHLYWGFRVFDNLRNGDFGALWTTIRTQVNYPPLQSIVTGIFSFLTGGFSIEKARVLSIIWFWGSVVLLWKIGALLEIQNSSAIAEATGIVKRFARSFDSLRSLRMTQVIPVLLFVTSPLVLFYSSNHMKEGLGAFLTLLTIYFYFKTRVGNIQNGEERFARSFANAQDDKRYLLLAGISLLLTTFEKYNYGLLLAFAFGIEALIELVSKSPSPSSRLRRTSRLIGLLRSLKSLLVNNILLFGPMVLALFFWVVWPKDQLEFFFYTLRSDWNIYSLYDTSMLVHVLFFPLEIITSYSFSYLVGLILLMGYLGALRYLKDRRVRVLFSFFTMNLILGTLHYYNDQARYIYTAVLALFLLTGYVSQKFLIFNFKFLNKFKFLISKTLKRKPILLGVLGGVGAVGGIILIIELIRLPFMIRPTAAHVNLAAVYGEKDYRDNLFNYNKFLWPNTYQGNIFTKQMEVTSFITSQVDLTKPVYFFGRTNEFSPPLFDLLFGRERERLSHLRGLGNLGNLSREAKTKEGINEYFVTLEVQPGGILDTGDYKKMNRDYSNSEIARFKTAANTQMLSSRTFNEFGLTVEVWGR